MRKNKFVKKIFWDYDIDKADLNNPEVKLWYLTRKLEFGDLSGVTENDLREYLTRIDIDPSLKELLQNYLKININNEINQTSKRNTFSF